MSIAAAHVEKQLAQTAVPRPRSEYEGGHSKAMFGQADCGDIAASIGV
jgi:hypothetical protein